MTTCETSLVTVIIHNEIVTTAIATLFPTLRAGFLVNRLTQRLFLYLSGTTQALLPQTLRVHRKL